MKYKHKILSLYDNSTLERELNKYSEEGWEVVSVLYSAGITLPWKAWLRIPVSELPYR